MDIQIQKPDCEFEKNLKFLYYHIKDDYLREKEEINKKINKLSSLLNVLVTALCIFILLCATLSMIIDNCKAIIYEPFSTSHTDKSIADAAGYGITMSNGQYIPTYGVYSEGTYLNHRSCYYSSGVAIDTNHFALQRTIKDSDLDDPIFQLPNGITKLRVYIWLEGQDVDSLETHSTGAPIDVVLDFIKDLAGYDEY